MINLFTLDGTATLLTNFSTALNIAFDVSAVIFSIFGVRYLVQLREKQNEAVFSYLARMRSRLNFILIILEKDGTGILTYLKTGEDFDYDSRESMRDANLRKSLAEQAKLTLGFLSDTENQYPPEGLKWSHCMNSFYRLLFVCVNLASVRDSYWTKQESNETKEKEFLSWVEDTKIMLSLIEEKQALVEKRLSPIQKRIIHRITNLLLFRFLASVIRIIFQHFSNSKPIVLISLKIDNVSRWMKNFIDETDWQK